MLVAAVQDMRSMAGYIVATASAALATLLPATSHADALHAARPASTRSSIWNQHWPAFSPVEGAATVAAGTGTRVLFSLKPPRDPRWGGGFLFDDHVRSGLRLHAPAARHQVRAWRELPYFAAPLIPLIIDPVVASWLARGDTKTALNLELIGVEAFSYAGLLSFVSTRERADSAECRPTHDDPSECERDTESVHGGHTTIAAASAGLVCANHRAMPLGGHPVADGSACALVTPGAVASGVTGIAPDRHDTSDVVAGFGAASGIGYAIPTLLHYTSEDTDVKLSISPGSPCTGACLKLAGSF
jgi:hypothetical protein